MIIDACRPYDRLKTFPPVARKSEAEAKELREKWPELFGLTVDRETTAAGRREAAE